MSYQRVIPRDFFNEAKLLKCMGQLSLKIHDGDEWPSHFKVTIEEPDNLKDQFDIRLTIDGRLFVSNYTVIINGRNLNFSTTYNSKLSFPMVCIVDNEEITVFDDNGNFTDEFLNLEIV